MEDGPADGKYDNELKQKFIVMVSATQAVKVTSILLLYE